MDNNPDILSNLLTDFIDMAESMNNKDDTWREMPVDLLTFFSSEDYLNEKPYPGKQTEFLDIVDKTIKYKFNLAPDECPEELRSITELCVVFGKGSGKDFLVSGIMAYMVYLLCCLNNPQRYFNFGQDEPIDLINIAINATQANDVFFTKLKARISNCRWFKRVNTHPKAYNEYQLTKNKIRFFHNIVAHSAHSEAESFEGYSPIIVIFDEIASFAPKNAEQSYSILRSSAISRFNSQALLIFISYPRGEDDFIMQKYKEATELNDPEVYAIRGATWEVNLKAKKEDYAKDYETDPEGARTKYESLTGDTLIYTVDGAYTIKELSDNSLIRTPSGEREVKAFINSGKKQVYEVRTKEGYTIEGSANHPLKVYSNKANWKDSSGLVWKTIGELRKGDLIYLDLNNDLYGEATISKEMAYLSGVLLGNGTLGQRSSGRLYATWYFSRYSNLVSVCQTMFINEFGVFPQIKSYKCRDYDITMRTDKQDILQKFLQIGLKPCNVYNKYIPETMFKQSKEIIIEFLKGLFDTDGCVSKRGTVSLASVNKNLLLQVQQLLLMLGIRSRLNNPQQAKDNIIKSGLFKGKIIKSGVIYTLNLSMQESVIFNNIIQLYTEHKNNRQDMCKTFDKCNNFKYQLPFCTVDSIIPTGEKECYDLWVEPENEFTANGMVAHNCIPPAVKQGFFQFPEKIDEVIKVGKQAQCSNLVLQDTITTRQLENGEQRYYVGYEVYNLHLNPSYVYYLGGDCGIERDSYVIDLVHAEPVPITTYEDGEEVTNMVNKPIEDLIIRWKPKRADRIPVDLLNVADILEMICKQVRIKKALFDKFNSAEIVQRLVSYGVDAEDKNFSNAFQLQIYSTLKHLIYSGMVELLDHTVEDRNELNANEELKAIKLINGNKIDHDRDKSKDYNDARASAIWLCYTDVPEISANFSMPSIKAVKMRH